MFSIFPYQNNKSRKKNPIRHGEVVPSLEILGFQMVESARSARAEFVVRQLVELYLTPW